MKKLFAALFLLCLASTTPAKADILASGSITSQIYATGNTCNSSGSGDHFYASCSDPSLPDALGYIDANFGYPSGSFTTEISSASFGQTPLSFETANLQLSLTGVYMLTGGTGYGFAYLNFNLFDPFQQGHFSECLVTLGSQSAPCDGAVSLYEPYNTPLNLDLEVDYYAGAKFGDGAFTSYSYDFSALTPTPEPASLLLLGTGLIPLVQGLRRRA